MSDLVDPAEHAAALHEQAIAYRESGAFLQGETACREAVALFEVAEGDGSPNLANALVEHARLLEFLDRFTDATAAADRALAILHPVLNEATGDPTVEREIVEELLRLTVQAESARASALRANGNLDAAEAGCQRALDLAAAHLPADDSLIASELNALAVVHKFQGRYDDAEPLYRRALAIAESQPETPERTTLIATLLHNLGGLAHARGDFAAGEPLARQSVELHEVTLGSDHPVTAADRAAWGALLEGMGRLEEAERAYAEALTVFEARLGPLSAETASSLTALGGVQHARGADDAAELSFRRSLEIRRAILPPGHFDTGLTLNNLAMLLVARGATKEARTLLEESLAIFEGALGPDHSHTRLIAKNLEGLAAST